MAKKRRGEDPVARFQEEARWSGFTNSWSRSGAPPVPRWVRRMIIAAFVIMAVVGLVVGLIGLLTEDQPSVEGLTGCPTHETSELVSCLDFVHHQPDSALTPASPRPAEPPRTCSSLPLVIGLKVASPVPSRISR
jgi:hypothetical protein